MRRFFLASALLLSAVMTQGATTTWRFCSDSADGSSFSNNLASAVADGWSFTSTANGDKKDGSTHTYSYPLKFVSGRVATAPACGTGEFVTGVVLGAQVSNVSRTISLTPIYEGGTTGTAQIKALTNTGMLEDVTFSFDVTDKIVSFSLTFTVSGSSTAYLYYATVTTETSGGGGDNHAPVATQPSVDVDATVGTAAEVDLSDYFTDADGDPLTYALDTGVGAVSGSIWSFTPDSTGSFSAEVSATDPSGDSAPLYIAVTAVLPPLFAPTFEPIRPEDATADGFVLRWMPIEGAVAYELSVTNAATGMGVGATVTFSIPSGPDPDYVVATVSDLDSDTTYEVAARALATTDPSFPSLDYSDSDWSTPVEIATTLEGGLQRAVLLDEGFSGADNAWSNPSAKPGDAETDFDSWTFPAFVYNARSAVKLGKTDATAWALSPKITLSNEVTSANIVLSFSAATFPTKTTKFSVSVVDVDTGATNAISSLASLSPTALDDDKATVWSGGTDYSETITVPTHFKLLFETLSTASDKRLLLDSIKVTQVYDPNFAALAAPTGVAGSDIGKHGFTVSWTGVANATGYEVWLDGAVAGSCASTDTSMDLTGLSDGTEYSVQAKALGDNLHFGDSPLSTAISVTTLADTQKIDFTVTGAPAGDVFAGDAVAFTVTAENEATHAAEPVSFSGIAGATFTAATGAFSWTPTEGDVGSHTATFTSGDYSTNVTITVVSALKAETLAAEYFSKITSTSWKSSTGYAATMDGDLGTWTGISLIKTKSAIIVGKADETGTAVSPVVELKARTPGSLSVSFDTGSLPGKKASVQARLLDAADGRVLCTAVFPTVAALSEDATAVADAGARATIAPDASVDLPAAVRLEVTTYKAAGDDSFRAYVDTVVFAQTVSARIPDLAAPTGLAVVEGSVATNGFAVSWSVVSDATNYAVRVTDAAGSVVFSAPFCATTSAAVTGLADDEVYAVQVRATGDEAICFASPWSDALAVRTARSPLHPTLSFGAWQNAVGDGKVYGGLLNTAAVTAVRDNGTNAVVTLASVLPAPAVGPTFEDNVLSWIPADADTNKTFTISFLMDGTYATNLSFKVLSIAPLAPPTVTAGPVAWDAFGLAWDPQYRAADYAVRVWTDCPNPGAMATRMAETFAGWPAARPSWWSYHNMSSGYKDAAAPVSFDATGDELKTYDLGGPISSVSFHVIGHSISESTSTLTVVGIAADGTETTLGALTVAEIGTTTAGIDQTYTIAEGLDIRRIAWRYTKDGNTGGNVGVGSVVIEGTGFSTPRWLPGWGPVAKDVGLVQACTVAKPRPGKALGVDPADKTKDLEAPRINYAEVTVRDAAGATLATVVAVKVPAPPRSARATLMILK